ncbi:signal transduction histidine kinase [Symbiobacterium terraclitae]|uniref:histidine kinase n=1 Tax=Symbiobacterium terraclitae TaxID=557451 RepID=A0ABS4JWJ3_9FIRM|nr:HAMP domain-containing sensor histidine kinase [Symbiobacterium terraclitae]MBP2019365.1 signal transduction histidine kinase [Symbiobacterium terraclitae]
MRNLNLVGKLWLSLSLLLLFVLIPLEYALDQVLERFYATQVTEPLLYHSRQLADMLAADEGAIVAAPMMAEMVGGEVVVLDEAGRPLEFVGASAVVPPEGTVQAVIAGRTFTGQLQTPEGRTFIVTGVPISGGGGGVLLLAPADPLRQSLQLARRYLWLASGITLLLGTGLALVMARSLTRPVLAMERATRSIATGDFSVRVAVDSTDEIGRLGQAINRMAAQLETYESNRREFLANVAHELRTPLSYIRGYTQALAEGIVTDPAEVRRYQQIVLDESIRVGRLVDDLMDLAQMGEGGMAFELIPLDLRVPVEQAALTVRPRAEEKGVRLAIDLPQPLPPVPADGGRIQQVVFNLLDNALRYTPAGGEIRVTAEAGVDAVTVRVRDTGEGIAPDLLPHVFDRFFGRRQGGRGLGLAVVRSIVRAHGGHVGAESRQGEGSTFWFRLPRTRE